MNVRRYDSPLRFFVQSRTRPGEHLVELSANPFNNVCKCEHFQIRLAPVILGYKNSGVAAENVKWDMMRCQHLNDAREFLLNESLEHYEKKFPHTPQDAA